MISKVWTGVLLAFGGCVVLPIILVVFAVFMVALMGGS